MQHSDQLYFGTMMVPKRFYQFEKTFASKFVSIIKQLCLSSFDYIIYVFTEDCGGFIRNIKTHYHVKFSMWLSNLQFIFVTWLSIRRKCIPA